MIFLVGWQLQRGKKTVLEEPKLKILKQNKIGQLEKSTEILFQIEQNISLDLKQNV